LDEITFMLLPCARIPDIAMSIGLKLLLTSICPFLFVSVRPVSVFSLIKPDAH